MAGCAAPTTSCASAEVSDYDLVASAGLDEVPGVVIDELETTPMIARGRLVRTDDHRVYLRMSALTRAITTVVPEGVACYRIVPSGNSYVLAKLDAPSTIVEPRTLYFDDVDPTPDFWGQPTPAVQADIDAALELAVTRPVYTCAVLDKRPSGMLVWAAGVRALNRRDSPSTSWAQCSTSRGILEPRPACPSQTRENNRSTSRKTC